MNRRMFVASLALAALAVLGIVGPTTAGEQVPFQGSYEGSFTFTPLEPPLQLVVAIGEGQATQLGHFSFVFPLIANTALRTGSGTYTFTAANGDTVVADVVTYSTLLPSGLRLVEEIGIITGGTGRFAGATGSFTGERLLNRTTREVIGFFDGTISSPGN